MPVSSPSISSSCRALRPTAPTPRRGRCTAVVVACREVTQEQAAGVRVSRRAATRCCLAVRSADVAAGPQLASAPGTTWAVDVSPALGAEAPATTQSTSRFSQAQPRRRSSSSHANPARYHAVCRSGWRARPRPRSGPRRSAIAAASVADCRPLDLALDAGTGKVITQGTRGQRLRADPKVAEVRPASANSLFVFGVSAGRTTVAALDAAGRTIVQYDVTVQPSAFGAMQTQSMISRLVSGQPVQVQTQPKGLLLSGTVPSATDAAQAVAIAKGYLAEGQMVENQITIASPIQVTLKVRIAQVQRSVLRGWASIGRHSARSAGSRPRLPPICHAPAPAARSLTTCWVDGRTARARRMR